MSEECRRRKFFRERTAVHRYERFAGTLTFVVQMVGDMLLARAVLAEYHHAHVSGSYQPYPVHDFLKGGTFTGEHRHTALSRLPFFLYGTEKRNQFILHKLFGNIVY